MLLGNTHEESEILRKITSLKKLAYPIKKYAYLPKRLPNGKEVWLEYYFQVGYVPTHKLIHDINTRKHAVLNNLKSLVDYIDEPFEEYRYFEPNEKEYTYKFVYMNFKEFSESFFRAPWITEECYIEILDNYIAILNSKLKEIMCKN